MFQGRILHILPAEPKREEQIDTGWLGYKVHLVDMCQVFIFHHSFQNHSMDFHVIWHVGPLGPQ